VLRHSTEIIIILDDNNNNNVTIVAVTVQHSSAQYINDYVLRLAEREGGQVEDVGHWQ
jgi:hypothetical protein